MSDRFSNCLSLLQEHKILEYLSDFSPEFVGSIPIRVDHPNSDLDLICNLRPSLPEVLESFSKHSGFMISERVLGNIPSLICRFKLGPEKVEIVAQSIPSRKQIAYLHLKIEERILEKEGETFRLAVLDLKKKGKTTEEAFGELIGLEGDPYSGLIQYGKNLGLID